jgi:hypothetical protein
MLQVTNLIGFGSGAEGGNDPYVKLLLHCDGTDASTTFIDSSTAVRTMTAVANAQIDTAQSKFGGASGLFDGSGDYVSAADSPDWDLPGGDFTIDLWARWNAVPGVGANQFFVAQEDVGTDNWIWYVNNTAGQQALTFFHQTSSTIRGMMHANMTIANSTWYHFAVEKTGTTTNFYQDGTRLTTVVDTAWGTPGVIAASLRVGGRLASVGSSDFNGWLDEVRISQGIARYNGSNFTPPSIPYY